MFNNIMVNDYTYASRFIASWLRAGGNLCNGKDYSLFKDWLESLNISTDDIDKIYFLASTGKMELERSAGIFLSNIEKEES